MKIFILITQYELGGAQKATISLADFLFARKHDVTVIFLYDKQGDLGCLQQEKPYPILNLHAKRGQDRLWQTAGRAVRMIFAFLHLMRREKPDVVQTMTHYSNVLGLPLAWLANVPVRVSSQRSSPVSFPRWLVWLDALVANSFLTTYMVAVSSRVAQLCEEVEKIHPTKLVTIPNGIDVTLFQQDNLMQEAVKLRQELGLSDKFVVLTVARLHFLKGHHYLLLAIKELVLKYPEMRFVWVGDGEMRDELSAEIEQLNLAQNILLLGVRRDIAQLLAMSDLFVLPSISEGMPNVILEAMAARRPVIATDIEGTVGLVVHEQTGFLVVSKSPLALGDAIDKLYGFPELRAQLAEAGFLYVGQNFSIEVMCEQFLSLYQGALEDSRYGKRGVDEAT